MKTYYMPEKERSLFGIKAPYMAMASYVVVIAYRLIRTLMFIVDSDYLADYDLLTKVAAFLSTYYNYSEFFLALIPLVIVLFERKSKFVRFHSYQYLIMNLFLPLIYRVMVLVLYAFVLSSDDVIIIVSFFYGVLIVFGMMAIFTTFLSAYATYCAYKGRTTNFPIFSSIAYRLAKIPTSPTDTNDKYQSDK